MVNLETIGRRIALIRAKQDMSQEDLAGEAEINRGYLSRIENGHVAFSIPVLLKIAEALNVAPDSLLRDWAHTLGIDRIWKVWYNNTVNKAQL